MTFLEFDEVGRDVLDITVPELLDLYCVAKPSRREDLRAFRLRKWREQFASLPAWQVTSPHIAAVVDAMEAQEYEGAMINRDVADIRSCYSWAIKRRYCPVDFINPTVEYVRRPETIRRGAVSELQVARLLAQAKVSRWPKLYPLVLTALHTGGRKAELLKLTWADVDAQRLVCGLKLAESRPQKSYIVFCVYEECRLIIEPVRSSNWAQFVCAQTVQDKLYSVGYLEHGEEHPRTHFKFGGVEPVIFGRNYFHQFPLQTWPLQDFHLL